MSGFREPFDISSNTLTKGIATVHHNSEKYLVIVPGSTPDGTLAENETDMSTQEHVLDTRNDLITGDSSSEQEEDAPSFARLELKEKIYTLLPAELLER